MFTRARCLSRGIVVRSRNQLYRSHEQCRSASSIWDRVQPSLWHPIATLEQSILEMDRMTSGMLSAPFRFTQSMLPRYHLDDDDFFKGFLSPPSQNEKESKEDSKKEAGENEQPVQSFSSYSYSSSTIFDREGHQISSMRRRYEDSMGRLKAVHEREIDGKKLKTVWQRKGKDDKGKHKTVATSTSADEFEELWKTTPFGAAENQQKKNLGVLKINLGECSKPKRCHNSTTGPDYEAANRAPDKEVTEHSQAGLHEASQKSREQAIAEGSKNQEEETTLQYN